MPVSPTGELIDEKGNPIGGKIDVSTGQFIEKPPTAITRADLSPVTPLNLPQQQVEPDYTSALQSIPSYEDILKQFQASQKAETTSDDLIAQILGTTAKLGTRQQSQFEAEQKLGLPEQQRQLVDVIGQIQSLQKEAAAIPLQIQEEFAGRAGVRQQQLMTESDLRKNTIKALGLSAIAQTLQGNVALAQSQANRAVDLEFAPEENKLKFLQTAYAMNKDILEREDKKRADALALQLGERQRLLDEQKENRKRIFDITFQAGQMGAPSDIQNKMLESGSPERALSLGGFYLGEDFRRKVDQDQFQRDLQIATLNLSRDKFNQDVKQFNLEYALNQQKIDYDKLKDAQKMNPVSTAEVTGEILQDKISLIDSLIRSPGLKGSVGPYPVSRFTPFSIDKAARQEFSAGVTQLLNKETIDTLVNLKARGGTLGALSDQERILLQSAATKIGNWEIKDKNNVGTGRYATSEENFKAELNRIRELAIKAKARALGGGPVQTNTEADELRAAGYSEEQIRLLMEL